MTLRQRIREILTETPGLYVDEIVSRVEEKSYKVKVILSYMTADAELVTRRRISMLETGPTARAYSAAQRVTYWVNQ